jgi:hypothetical protein
MLGMKTDPLRAPFAVVFLASFGQTNSRFLVFSEAVRGVFGEVTPLCNQVSLDYRRRKKDNVVFKRSGATSLAKIGVLERSDDRKQFFSEDLGTE